MKKTLITILIILLLIVLVIMLANSLHLGGLHILGLRDLNAENKKLDSGIQNLSILSSAGYEQAIAAVSKSAKEYEQAKSDYNELVEISTSNDIVSANQLQKYEIEYLWAKIGKHATDEDVVLKLQIVENGTSAATGYYDINFAAEGDYVGITDFVYDIENDSSLGFKIEKFKMQPLNESENKLLASFTCTNIAINIDSSLIVRTESETENENETNSENTQTSDNTNTNTTNTNSTNTVN